MYSKTKITLNNGIKIPRVQLGTWLMDNNEVKKIVQKAIRIGYRGFDTARDYGNEAGVGKGIWNSDIERSDLFLTTKLPTSVKDYEGTKQAIDQSLQRFSLDYIDLMLIHSPQPWIEVNRTDDRHFEGNLENWRALEDALKDGKVRTIGVSNFLEEDLDNIIKNGTILPAVNQIGVSIGNTPTALMSYCQNKGIVVEAYSPLSHGKFLNNEIIVNYAKKYNVSPAQLMLRYDCQLGCVVLPKSNSVNELKEDLQLDFEISNEDMSKLQELKF